MLDTWEIGLYWSAWRTSATTVWQRLWRPCSALTQFSHPAQASSYRCQLRHSTESHFKSNWLWATRRTCSHWFSYRATWMCLSLTSIASSHSSSSENGLFQKGIWFEQNKTLKENSSDILTIYIGCYSSVVFNYCFQCKVSFGNSNKFIVAADEHQWECKISSEKVWADCIRLRTGQPSHE